MGQVASVTGINEQSIETDSISQGHFPLDFSYRFISLFISNVQNTLLTPERLRNELSPRKKEEEKPRLTMIVKGEAYMMMEKIVEARPQNNFLVWPWRASSEISTTAANTARTKVRSAKIFPFSFLGANMRKISTQIDSITAPVPLIVDTNKLFGDTNGKPYLFNPSTKIQKIIYRIVKLSN